LLLRGEDNAPSHSTGAEMVVHAESVSVSVSVRASVAVSFSRIPGTVPKRKGNGARVPGCRQSRRPEERLLVFEFRCKPKRSGYRKPRATTRMEFRLLVLIFAI
jgi:hypothetical protein